MRVGTAIGRWLLPVPSTHTRDIAQLLALSALIQCFFLLTAYPFSGGSFEFRDFAKALVALLHGNLEVASNAADRSVGYPILLILSGFFQSGSLIGIMVIQALMAMLIPILIYLAVERISSAGAYYIALASVISLGPFLFVKWVYHDQPYIFFCILTLWMFSRFIHTKRSLDLLLLTLAIVGVTFIRPAGGLLFPALIVVAYLIVRGQIGRYIGVVALFIVVVVANQYFRDKLLYFHGAKPNEYTGGQIFADLYFNSLDYGIQLSPDLGPNMKEATDKVYQALLPSPRSSEFLAKMMDAGAPPSDFHDNVIVPFENKYFYPYSADEFRTQLYRLPNWEYYLLMVYAVPDSVLLHASWEIFKAYPLLPIRYTARNLWYFLYEPGYLHTRYNPVPIFHGGLFLPFDGESAVTGGALGGANEAILSLPARAYREVTFDIFNAQPDWMKQTYRAVRAGWLGSYDAAARSMFFLIIVAWTALIADWTAGFTRSAVFGKWATIANANQLASHIFYVTTLLLYSAGVTAAFSEPDYRNSHMLLLIKLVLAGYGALAIARIAREFLPRGIRSLGRYPTTIAVSDKGYVRFAAVVTALGLAIAVCAGWSWYMIVHTW